MQVKGEDGPLARTKSAKIPLWRPCLQEPRVASSSEQSPQNPSLRLQAKVEEVSSDIYISSNNSAHNQYQKDVIEICTGNLPKRFVHEGFWEVLDEGIGGSLKTHLQEVLPCYKGEQSLTFKRHQGSTADAAVAYPQNRPKC